MKSKWNKVLVVFCSVVMLLTCFSNVALAWYYPEEYPGSFYNMTGEIPEVTDATWETLSAVTATRQTSQYFILSVKAGERAEELYISLPKEGGIRLQSLHEVEKAAGATAPIANNAGELEPSGLNVIDYKKDGNAVVLTAADGTLLRYVPENDGFSLRLYNGSERIIDLTNEQISYAYDKHGEVVSIAVEMPLIEKEAITGGGERFNDANQVGHKISLVNADSPSTDAFTYVNVPLFHSNRGYSLWFNMTGVGRADFGVEDPEKYTISFDQSGLDLYLWAGMPQENLKKYTAITGTSGLSETWTFGFWTGASTSAYTGRKLKNAYANLERLLEGYKEHYNFYPEAVYGENALSDARSLSFAKERGTRVLYWIAPQAQDYDNRMENYLPGASKFPTFDSEGNMVETGWPFAWNTPLYEQGYYEFMGHSYTKWYDFSNPSAVDAISATFTQLWDWGLAGSMIDFGEMLDWTGTFFNGMQADQMHNFNSYYYAKTFNEAWGNKWGNDYVLFQRSGTAGSQYYVGNFLGDQDSDWEGLQDQVRAMINFGASGYNLYGGDLGALSGKPSNDLWNRWVVLSTFSPYMRQHGAGNIHHPWEDYGELAKKTFGNYYYFRKNIVPAVESAAIDANKTSNPIVKGMMMAYPYQLPLADISNQYLFCDDFLVCTVTDEGVWYQQAVLPKGSTWYDLYSYKAYTGGQILYAEAPTSTMPVFVKGGAVKAINLPESMTLGTEMHDDAVDEYQTIPALLITPPDAKRTSTIHVKDGASEDYRTYKSHTEVYTSTPGEGAVFTVANDAGSPREIVLALGVTAAEITVDGEPLTRLDHTPDYMSYEYGYYVDYSGMTTMLLPTGWKTLKITKGDSGYEPLETVTDGVAAYMLDGKVETTYTLPPKAGDFVEVELKQAATIGRITVKWGVGYSDVYDIEYSADGENWGLLLPDVDSVNTVSGGTGSVDIIDFEAVEAKYLRLYSVENGDTAAMPSIYTLEIYAPDTFTPLTELIPEDEDIGDEEDDWSDEEFDGWEGNGDETDEDEDEEQEQEDQIIQQIVKKRRKKNTIAGGLPTWAIILIIGGGVLVLAGLLLLFLLLRRKKKKEQAEQALNEVDVDFPNPPEG